MSHSSIIGFGMYLPHTRISIAEIAKHRGEDPHRIEDGLGVKEKTVPCDGEDSFTMAYEASRQALEIASLESEQIAAVFVGSESHPYAVKPTSGMLASVLGVDPFCHAGDLEFACKAGTACMQIVDAFVQSGRIRYGLAVGTDTAQARPGDALEYTAAAGAAAMIIGPSSSTNALCRIDTTLSYTTDTPDFWRASGAAYPSHAGRFTGEPGYFHHMKEAIGGILSMENLKSSDIDHVVLHMPNAKFPSRIARDFGFTTEQMESGFIVPTIGNTYSACSLIGLCHVLERAKNGERILLASYGSGAGCDVFVLTMQRNGVSLPCDMRERTYLTFSEYAARRAAVHA